MRHFESFDIFEWAHNFGKQSKTNIPVEVATLSLLTVVSKKSTRGEAFFSLKGKVAAFMEAQSIASERIAYELPEKFLHIPVLAMLHPTRSVVLTVDGRMIGLLGELHPTVLKNFGLEARLAVAGFLAEELLILQEEERVFVPLQKFPYALRDISLTFPRQVVVAQVEALFREAGAPLLQKWELFDIYEQEAEKSFAFHLSFGTPLRTLSSKEMDDAFDRIVTLAQERFAGRLRS